MCIRADGSGRAEQPTAAEGRARAARAARAAEVTEPATTAVRERPGSGEGGGEGGGCDGGSDDGGGLGGGLLAGSATVWRCRGWFAVVCSGKRTGSGIGYRTGERRG